MMQTLLDKVTQLEADAQQQIAEAQERSKKALSSLLADEQRVLADARERAESKAAAIVKERIQHAKSEINKLRQDEERSVQVIHEVADKNRDDAVAFALELFKQQYLS